MDSASLAPSTATTSASVYTPSSTSATPSQPPSQSTDFQFPPHYTFPPFFTLQPNLTTLSRQLALWSSLIQSYCAYNRIFKLSLSSSANSPLFHNASLSRTLDVLSIRRVLDYMASADGDYRAEWVPTSSTKRSGTSNATGAEKSSAWVYWRRPEEWADLIYNWVDGTGQKGSVLTVYELRESDAVQREEWIGMDEELFRRCLDALIRKGKAQVFGTDDGAGVKFF